jgi:cytoskeleton protein RodZ
MSKLAVSMNDFGGKLRQAREGRGITLRQIAASTKISVAALEALERNDLSKLPGGVFSRAFVRSYAAEIGLDPDQVLHEFLHRFDSPSAAITAAGLGHEEAAFERRKKVAATVFLIALAVMLLLASGLVYYLLRNRPL